MFLALILNDSVELEFMMEPDFQKLLQKPDSKEGKKFWREQVTGLDAIIGGASVAE